MRYVNESLIIVIVASGVGWIIGDFLGIYKHWGYFQMGGMVFLVHKAHGSRYNPLTQHPLTSGDTFQ